MLNKDEYDQEEYENYYAQETRGAEILSKKDDSGGGGKKILFMILLLALIGVGGYFGFTTLNSSKSQTETNTTAISQDTNKNSSNSETTSDDSIVKKSVTEKTKKDILSDKEKISKEVESVVSTDNSNGNMNPEDIANIVQMVMQKMNEEKKSGASDTTSKPITKEQIQDNRLQESLQDTEVDSLVSELEKIDVLSEDDKSKKATISKVTDTYNKVLVKEQQSTTVDSDELSKLSDEISNVIAEDIKKETSEYAKEVTKEAKTRKKEMRYVVVKKGDTLGKIAKRVYGNVMDYKKIYAANPDILRRPDRIYIGQKLRVPE
jgi:LysM repeat protein